MCTAHFARLSVRPSVARSGRRRNYRVPTHFCGSAGGRPALAAFQIFFEAWTDGLERGVRLVPSVRPSVRLTLPTVWTLFSVRRPPPPLPPPFRAVPRPAPLQCSSRSLLMAVDTWATPQGSSDPFILPLDGEYCFSKPIPAAERTNERAELGVRTTTTTTSSCCCCCRRCGFSDI